MGDRLATDILFAKRGQIDSLLVFTGIQKRDDVEKMKPEERPEWIADCVGRLLQAREVLKDEPLRN